MKRRPFLTSLLALLPFRCVAKIDQKSEGERLNDDFYKAAAALIRYKYEHGFEPGAKVRCHGSKPIVGVIAPYGNGWEHCDHPAVLVDLDNGRHQYRQPWDITNLTIIEPAPPR